MKQCKYAGDINDVNCKDCNGISMIIGDKEESAETCKGYEPGDDVDYRDNQYDPLKEQTFPEENNKIEKEDRHISDIGTPVKISFKSGLSFEKDGMWYKFEIGEEQTVEGLSSDRVKLAKQELYDKLNQEIKIKAKQVTEDLINFMQDLDTENNYQIKELQRDIEYYKSRIGELEKQIEKNEMLS